MSTKDKLLAKIDRFLLSRPDISQTKIGLEVANDGKLIPQLRAGRNISIKTSDDILNYIAENSQNHEHSAA